MPTGSTALALENQALRQRIAELEANPATLPKIGRVVYDGEQGEPCDHSSCLSHVTHPCEGCGRIGGREGRIVFDVVASLGTEVYWIDPKDASIRQRTINGLALDRLTSHIAFRFADGGCGFDVQCYNTQAAAQFAIEQKALTPNPAVRGGG